MASSSLGLPDNDINPGGSTSTAWMQWFQRLQNVAIAAYTSGVTADRPAGGLWVGRFYFDTTLGKPVWVKSVKPAVWVDATGAVV